MLQSVLDLFFPPQCANCDAPGAGLCECCFPGAQPSLPFALATLRGVALGEYDGALRRSVLALKDGRRDVARALGARLGAMLSPAGPALVPVPTTATRRRERGFDGCVLVAEIAAACSRREALPCLVQRAGDAQRGRNRSARLAAAGRFYYDGAPLGGREVVVLDDVVTTGATLEDCARTLRNAGARVVGAVVVARAPMK